MAEMRKRSTYKSYLTDPTEDIPRETKRRRRRLRDLDVQHSEQKATGPYADQIGVAINNIETPSRSGGSQASPALASVYRLCIFCSNATLHSFFTHTFNLGSD